MGAIQGAINQSLGTVSKAVSAVAGVKDQEEKLNSALIDNDVAASKAQQGLLEAEHAYNEKYGNIEARGNGYVDNTSGKFVTVDRYDMNKLKLALQTSQKEVAAVTSQRALIQSRLNKIRGIR